jgi:hypothetical protein
LAASLRRGFVTRKSASRGRSRDNHIRKNSRNASLHKRKTNETGRLISSPMPYGYLYSCIEGAELWGKGRAAKIERQFRSGDIAGRRLQVRPLTVKPNLARLVG